MRTLVELSMVLAVGVFLLSLIDSTTPILFLGIIIFVGMIGSFVGTLAGGGGLITLPAMLLLGVPIHFCIATNKFSSGIASMSSVFVLLKKKELTMERVKSLIISSIIGGGLGAVITSFLPENLLNIIAIVLLVFAFIVSVQSRKWYNIEPNHTNSHMKISPKVMSFLIGVYDGGFGPGSTTFSIIYFIKSKFSYVKSIQFSRVLNFGSCLGAFIIFYRTGFLQWDYSIALATGSIIGTQIALKVVSKIPLKFAKGLITTILILLIVQVAWQI